MSFTQWFTMSWPTVSWRFIIVATLSLVPTPSMLLTSSSSLPGDWNSPPNEPQLLTAPAVMVDWIIFFAFFSAFILASISTPAEE